MTFDITIQIINYNTKKYLEKCLKGVINDLENSNIDYRIHILDNNSNDDLSDLERKFMENNKTFFYFSKRNLGFGKGHNYLAKKSDAKYILVLNPDVDFIEENTIKRLFERINADSKIKVIGPKLLTDKGTRQLWDHGELIGFLAWVALNSGDSYGKNRNDICEVAWVSGAFFLIEFEIFNRVGGFDENFFLYKEEEDLCLRIRKSGGKNFL